MDKSVLKKNTKLVKGTLSKSQFIYEKNQFNVKLTTNDMINIEFEILNGPYLKTNGESHVI